MARPGTLDSFGTILSGLSKRLGLESRLVELRLQHRWREIVGEPMASHTWPSQIRFKKLYLIVRNSVWLQQLTFLKPALVTKLHAEVGPELVTDIVGRVGELPGDLETPPVDLSPDIRSVQSEGSWAEVVTHTTTIHDPSLRERFREVISRYPVQALPQPAKGPSRAP
ncbi:DciA family protein [Nitrospira sp. CMX1]